MEVVQSPPQSPTLALAASSIKLPLLESSVPLDGKVLAGNGGYIVWVPTENTSLSQIEHYLFDKFSPRWAQLVVAQGERKASKKSTEVIVDPGIFMALRERVAGILLGSLSQLHDLTPVKVSWGGNSRLFAVCRYTDGIKESNEFDVLHRSIKDQYGLELLLEKIPRRLNLKVIVKGMRNAGRVLPPLDENSEVDFRILGRDKPAIISHSGLPTIAIDNLSTRKREDLVTAKVLPDGSVESWRFTPDNDYLPWFFGRQACPSFGVGYRSTPNGIVPLPPRWVLVKMHREFDGAEVASALEAGTLPNRFQRVIQALRKDLEYSRPAGRIPEGEGLVYALEKQNFINSSKALVRIMSNSDVRLIVRKRNKDADLFKVLSGVDPDIKDEEIHPRPLAAFHILRATLSDSRVSAEDLLDHIASNGAFAVRKPKPDMDEWHARIKGKSDDGLANQKAVMAFLYGTPEEPESKLRGIVRMLNQNLWTHTQEVKRMLHSPDLYDFVTRIGTTETVVGEVERIDVDENIWVNVAGYDGDVLLMKWDLTEALNYINSGYEELPLRWVGFNPDTGVAFVRLKRGQPKQS